MEKKIVIAKIQVVKGKESEYLDLVTPLINATRKEAGNLVYTLYQNSQDSSDFMMYEEYVNEEAFDAHGKSDHFLTFAKGVKPLLAKDLDIQIF